MEQHNIDKAILVGLNADCFRPEETATEQSLNELRQLLETAGGTCLAIVLQNRHVPDPHSFIGEGKAQEVRDLVVSLDANMVIFDNELSPSQIKALEELTSAVVLDRSALILDIFAQRAQTAEGRLQVELAQYRYLLPRLSGMGRSLSRLGGGIGTRGPGETKLETDRRHIRSRISKLESDLEDVRKTRSIQRERRIHNSIPVVALVGYTNAGKSTLLNQLTGSAIPANNRLFDTLDTTTRRLHVSDTLDVLLSDTVGFISKLPHHLVKAFRATLEELQYADLLVHVIDCSDSERDAHIEVVNRLISQLAKPDTPVIECYNKIDLTDSDFIPRKQGTALINARDGIGLDKLLQLIESTLNKSQHHCTFLFPYAAGDKVDLLHTQAQVLRCDYTADGIIIETICDETIFGRLNQYLQEEN